jgi:hypothetical protein
MVFVSFLMVFVSLWYFTRVFMSTLMPIAGRRRERENSDRNRYVYVVFDFDLPII